MKILITGFDPFGGETINPSFEAIKKIDNYILGAKIIKYEIPTVFSDSIDKLEKIIKKENPDIVICVGQAGGRNSISLERIAINIDDAPIADNKGNKPIDKKIIENGKNAYFTKLPIKLIAKEIRKKGIKAEISNSAGTFVCNHVMYGLLHLIENEYSNIRGGFIHVPFIKSQVKEDEKFPYMTLDKITEALTESIKISIENINDIESSEGKVN